VLFRSALEFFNVLLNRANLPRERLWIVPGNHDVDRNAGEFLQRTLDNEEGSQRFFANIPARDGYLKKFDNYKNFLTSLCPNREFADGDTVHKPDTIKINNFSLGILPLNSAWFAQDNSDLGKLWLGRMLIEERKEILDKLKPDLKIALLHHPFSYMHENEQAGEWLQDAVHIILRGHLHRAQAQAIGNLGTGQTIEITGGATYHGSQKPCRAYFARLNITNSILYLEPLQYVDRPGAKTWVLDPSVFPAEENYIGKVKLNIEVTSPQDKKNNKLKDSPD